MYLKRRLQRRSRETFCEIGCGTCVLSSLLLGRGMRGLGFDLNADGCEKNRERNAEAIRAGRYEVRNEDFLEQESSDRFDLLISSAVIEHLSEADEARYFQSCLEWLAPGGAIVVMVPNEVVLYPFHLLQMTFRHHPSSLGIYCEMVLRRSG